MRVRARCPKGREGFPIPVKVFYVAGVIVDVPFLEEAVELEAVEAKHPARLMVRVGLCQVVFRDEGVEGFASRGWLGRTIVG